MVPVPIRTRYIIWLYSLDKLVLLPALYISFVVTSILHGTYVVINMCHLLRWHHYNYDGALTCFTTMNKSEHENNSHEKYSVVLWAPELDPQHLTQFSVIHRISYEAGNLIPQRGQVGIFILHIWDLFGSSRCKNLT